MQTDSPGPAFWGLDGCNMDEDFAFCIWHETLEEWEQEQREMEESARRWEAKEAERKRLGVEYLEGGYADADYVWKRSFSATDTPGTPMVMRLFAIGSHLSELIVDLKEPTVQRDLIDRLSRAFGNLRDVCQSSDPAKTDALIEPVIASFCDALDAVAATRADLASKCDDLQKRLRRFLEPPGQIDDDLRNAFDEEDLPY